MGQLARRGQIMTVHPNTSRPRRHRALAQFRPLILEMLEERSLLTLTPQLLAELNSHQAGVEFDLSSNPRIAVADELVYFSGRSSSTAPYGLWKSDGTPAGTGLVKDVRPQSILTVSDVAYFITAGSKKALWRSDGTPEGTILLREFGSIFQLHNTTTDTSEAVNQTVYFVAQDKDDDAGLELWKTDGTPTGTIRVLDIAAGPASSLPRGLTSANGKLLFTANDAIHGRQLWTSDGTPQGTMPASNILLDAAFPPSLKDVNGTLFVAAHEGEFDTKLHKLDPATNELVFLADISRPGDARDFLTNLNGTLFFLVGEDLWRSDGTVPGTALVKSIKGITAISELGGALYFTLHTGSGFREIWKSDGTAVGTRPVTPPLSGATILTHHNGALHFIADSALWKTDGAASGTVRIKPLPTGFSQVNRVNGNLFFSATDGAEKLILWKSDLTESGPTTVVHLGVDKTANFISEKRPIAATAMLSGSIYLAASDGVHGEELWKTDGTPAGTVMVKDINPGMVSSSPSDFTVVNGTLFFTTDVGSPGVLWKTDGTSDGTVIFKEFPKTARLHGLVDVAGTLFFSVSHAQFSSFDPWHGLWKSDGTPEGTVRISNAVSRGDQRSLGGLLYFAGDAINHGNELWRSDGTPEGTYSLKDLYPGWIGSEPAGFTAVGQTVFFHTGFGTSLWMTDGTADGTVQIRSFEANYLTIFNNQLFFAGATLPAARSYGSRTARLRAPCGSRILSRAQPAPSPNS